MSYETVEVTTNHGVAVIRLNRPEQFNTLTAAVIRDLDAAYRYCDSSDDVRVAVLTGSGPAFCAGADMGAGGTTFDEQQGTGFSSCPLSIQPWQVRKPMIAACNGHAVGVGLSMALQCDLRVFAADAKYGLVQNRRGVIADNAVEYVLPRLIGFERAFELIVRAQRLSGTEAGQWGLASRVRPAEEVLDTALEIARDMADNCSPLVMAMHKRLLWRGLDTSLSELVELETRSLHYTMGRADAIEGGTAWYEKRAPAWRSSVSEEWPGFL